MPTLMKQCPMRMPDVDHLVVTARKESLMERSGPASQAVSEPVSFQKTNARQSH